MDHKILPELPAIIKFDFDGMNHLILLGAKETLRNPKCKTVLIKVNDSFNDQANKTTGILIECSFLLKEKFHQARDTYNHIWTKD